MWACLNGALIKPADEALLQPPAGPALLETMRWEGGKISLEPYHWQRLFAGIAALKLQVPEAFSPAYLQTLFEKLVRINGKMAGARLRLQVAGGGWLLITCGDLPPVGQPVRQAGIATRALLKSHALSYLKTNDRTAYQAAAALAQEKGWEEALVCNDAGHILESTIANIFWVAGNQVFTPPLSEGCIAGVMRAFLLERLPEMGFPVRQQPLTVEGLADADEVFLTNALRGVRCVQSIFGLKAYGNYFCQNFSHFLNTRTLP